MIEFVTVGNPGNGNDTGAGGGAYSSPYGGVPYVFKISGQAISQGDIDTAVAAGLTNVTAGPWSAVRPATWVTWYEAAAFVNWLNTSKGHQAAYNLTFSSGWSMSLWSSADAWQLGGENLYRHKDSYYFLPSENEWFKAAFHKNDGVTANYWDYATASNAVPTAVHSSTSEGTVVYNQPWEQGPAPTYSAGGLSAYGTRGQTGNVWEWTESANDGTNTSSTENRVARGGSWSDSEAFLRPTNRSDHAPTFDSTTFGFRVASVPEPSSAMLLLLAGGGLLLRARRNSSRSLSSVDSRNAPNHRQ